MEGVVIHPAIQHMGEQNKLARDKIVRVTKLAQ